MQSSSDIIHKRFLGFLIWQFLHSSAVFILFRALILPLLASSTSHAPTPLGVLSFFVFHLAALLFSVSLFAVSSPRSQPPALPLELALGLFKLLLVSGDSSPEFRSRAKVSLGFLLTVTASAISGALAVASICWVDLDGFMVLGFRGFVVGLLYGVYFVYKRRWVLEFPIIQRPAYFSFKMGVASAITLALKLSCIAYLLSALWVLVLPDHFKSQMSLGKYISGQFVFYFGSFGVILCWEIAHHLHKTLLTKRATFAPPKGSAAAETNPSEPLIVSLEASSPGSLLQYLAYLDLCLVCESNVDVWRRAALFEETGDTYKRVVHLSLRPLEQLATSISEIFEGNSVDKASQLARQLQSPTDLPLGSKVHECFDNFQLYAWCARTIASLTVRSHDEDRFGVAQLSGSNAATISTLVSCLLAVETFMGKKTHLQTPHLMGAAGIKWATVNTGRQATTSIVSRQRNALVHSKAYAMADLLRTSIYSIVTAFHDEMLNGAKSGGLDKDWVINTKPPYGTRELLSQKLRLFIDFRAC
ncbi:unnamed protein product [Rhodiola kirilowii]